MRDVGNNKPPRLFRISSFCIDLAQIAAMSIHLQAEEDKTPYSSLLYYVGSKQTTPLTRDAAEKIYTAWKEYLEC